jgi:hypothetical protein
MTARCLYADAKHIEHVFAKGIEMVRRNGDAGARPGSVLRSGRDTQTLEAPGGANA